MARMPIWACWRRFLENHRRSTRDLGLSFQPIWPLNQLTLFTETVMDDTLYRTFFDQPQHPYQRQYEALRAVFIDGRSHQPRLECTVVADFMSLLPCLQKSLLAHVFGRLAVVEDPVHHAVTHTTVFRHFGRQPSTPLPVVKLVFNGWRPQSTLQHSLIKMRKPVYFLGPGEFSTAFGLSHPPQG